MDPAAPPSPATRQVLLSVWCPRVGEFAGLPGCPLREQSGMDHAIGALDVTQPLVAQPVQQFIAVRRLEDFLQGIVLAAALGAAFGDHQQVQVVVAEDGQGRVPKALDEAQCFEGFRPAIDEVAD